MIRIFVGAFLAVVFIGALGIIALAAGGSRSLDAYLVLIVGLPLVGFVVTALIGRRLDREAHWIPVGLIVLVWAISMVVAFATLTHAEPFGEAGHGTSLFTWIPAGDFQVHAAFYVDA